MREERDETERGERRTSGAVTKPHPSVWPNEIHIPLNCFPRDLTCTKCSPLHFLVVAVLSRCTTR